MVHLTKAQINEGLYFNNVSRCRFWNNLEKRIYNETNYYCSDGTVTTQTRTIMDYDQVEHFNGRSFTNETNTYTHGANTQNDFTIRTEMYNDTVISSYDNIHRARI